MATVYHKYLGKDGKMPKPTPQEAKRAAAEHKANSELAKERAEGLRVRRMQAQLILAKARGELVSKEMAQTQAGFLVSALRARESPPSRKATPADCWTFPSSRRCPGCSKRWRLRSSMTSRICLASSRRAGWIAARMVPPGSRRNEQGRGRHNGICRFSSSPILRIPGREFLFRGFPLFDRNGICFPKVRKARRDFIPERIPQVTKAEAVQIAATIEGPYLEMWKEAFAMFDPQKTVMIDPSTGDLHLGPADHFEEAGGEN